MRALVLALTLGLVACVDPSELCEPQPGDELVLALAGAWTPDERTEIERSLEMWRTASGGRVDVKIGSDADATLTRGRVEGSFEAFSRQGRWMRIDADALARDGWSARDGVGALTCSLVGRMLGMHLHDGQRGCLSRSNVTPELTEDDVDSCRAAGFCG